MNQCEWHKDEKPIRDGETIGCPECSRMIATRQCKSCHLEFIDWDSDNLDDVIAPPGATESGDFMCCWCARRYDERTETNVDYDP